MENQLPFLIFENEQKKEYELLINTYLEKLRRARDDFKQKAHVNFVKHINEAYQSLQQKLGSKNQRFLIEIRDELEDDKDLDFELLFNQKFESLIDTNKNIFLKDIAKLEALDLMYTYSKNAGLKYRKYEENLENTAVKNIQESTRTIKWTGKDLELVQLIYSLREGGFLTNENDEITSLVNQVATAFNHKLSDYWQSNLSDSVNNRNNDYMPTIFQKLPKAFNDYRDKLLANKKNR